MGYTSELLWTLFAMRTTLDERVYKGKPVYIFQLNNGYDPDFLLSTIKEQGYHVHLVYPITSHNNSSKKIRITLNRSMSDVDEEKIRLKHSNDIVITKVS